MSERPVVILPVGTRLYTAYGSDGTLKTAEVTRSPRRRPSGWDVLATEEDGRRIILTPDAPGRDDARVAHASGWMAYETPQAAWRGEANRLRRVAAALIAEAEDKQSRSNAMIDLANLADNGEMS